MSLTPGEFRALVEELKPLLSGATVVGFYAIELRKYVLLARKNEQEVAVLFCFQEPFLRLHRFTDKFQGSDNPFNKKIAGHTIQEFNLVNNDRIIEMTFRKKGALIAEFFPRRPNLFYVDDTNRIILAMNAVEHTVYTVPPNPHQKGETISTTSSQTIESAYRQKEREAAFKQEKQHLLRLWNQRTKKSRKGLEKALQELERCKQWEAVQLEAQLLQANMYKMSKGLACLSVEDWTANNTLREIQLNPRLEPKVEIANRFKLSKKLKGGIAFAEKRLIDAREETTHCEAKSLVLEAAATWEELSAFKPQAKPKASPKLPYHEFQTEAGLKIWVGKQAKANEQLTFSLARGSDWWLHVSDYPGSHVILKVKKNQEPDQSSLDDALQVAIAYSKAKDKGLVDVTLTQCKYVARLKGGPPGQVQISKHQTRQARFDAVRFERIKNFNH